ncbi:hypothetical protein PTTG_03780 [Puccinia triticina 1-1 BBBD Race 1]|uniref:Secreted protein n=2 Tax=Puccinia triticina TaxID=208348 RepID=A0A180GRH7_PUCT1|nr:uncharacterized protein PtA15_5A112 [Puccinia triticina]OAV94563.1 hypothetical protein PTTG_03780 [Puccinia triticina 1-1 BBBD Race 1]WAQ84542.1 hypothetical protein PtA15_5A112 [Puccinia triticina]WAR57885.1 hypothetical protein PtB15_5B115 [Puccinia triticina]
MKFATVATFAALSVPAVMATTHTMCYNYFLQKDGCVFSAAALDQRCPAPAKQHSTPVKAFAMASNSRMAKRSDVAVYKSASESHELERRYNTTRPSFAVAGGNGVCGYYDSKKEPGVCLWSGVPPVTVQTAGWLNGAKTSNCGKRVYIQRKGQPSTVKFVRVLDGCDFGTTRPDPGCFDIAVTIALFNLFNPTYDEQRAGELIGGITWDWDNLDNTHTQQAPV